MAKINLWLAQAGFAVIGVLGFVFVGFLISTVAYASQDAPNDLYAMQCIDGTCYYATGAKVPDVVLKKFEQEMAAELAKQEKQEGDE